MTYFNTANETGDELKQSRLQAERQEDKILSFFRKYPQKAFTPFAVQRLMRKNWPITSIRRAITNLTNDGELEKLPACRKEKYGKPNHLWRLKDEEQIKMF